MPSHYMNQCWNIVQYVNPLCCVVTVFHQVHCMYWGHMGHFHGAISHLKWHKIVCMRYLACTFCQMKSINIFPCICNLEFPDIFVWDLLWFEYKISLFSCLCMSMLTPNSSGNIWKYVYLGCFHVASTREIYICGLGHWNLKNKLHRNLKNAVENVVCEMMAIFCLPQCVK